MEDKCYSHLGLAEIQDIQERLLKRFALFSESNLDVYVKDFTGSPSQLPAGLK